MRNSAALRKTEEITPEMRAAHDFANELTVLSHKHGIAITGKPVLFVMEQDDLSLAYEVDDESNLSLTSA
jgi:hypothetical protein